MRLVREPHGEPGHLRICDNDLSGRREQHIGGIERNPRHFEFGDHVEWNEFDVGTVVRA